METSIRSTVSRAILVLAEEAGCKGRRKSTQQIPPTHTTPLTPHKAVEE
jgi:hypothetical protein